MGTVPMDTRLRGFRIPHRQVPCGRSAYGRTFQVMQFLPTSRSAVSQAHSLRPRQSSGALRSGPLTWVRRLSPGRARSPTASSTVCAGLADPPPPHSVGPAPSPSQTRAALHVPPPAYTDLVLLLDSLPATCDSRYRHSQPICYRTRGLGQ